MKFEGARAHAVVEHRGRVAREWSALRRAIRSETGLDPAKIAWLAGIAGLALGLELSRLWFGRGGRPAG